MKKSNPFGIQVASDVIASVKSLLIETTLLLATTALLGHQIGSTSNIVLGEEGVRNSEKPTDVIYGRPLGMDSQLCFVVITLLLM